ncbi:MAG: hypothetical protein V4793_07960 [Paraburkholderia tropica]|uniref:Uncharacterized protein n=1 Tax=Paraburkholderia tropica TaxID=92647 RepID=A0ABX5ML87_9BURK|nr:hypothetical protein C7400_11234 [Paraburkholderia tropica]PZW79493.1 hypothetical protein C7399_11234 [Paraburkholderia tropica]
MKRRRFIGVACGVSAVCCTIGLRRSQAALQRGARIAVVDLRLARGVALARHAARARMMTFAVDDDIGALWYARLACVGEGALVLCALRDSERFVLERLALSRRCVVMNVPSQIINTEN